MITMDPMVLQEYTASAVSNIKDLGWACGVPEPRRTTRSSLRTRPRRQGPASLVETAVRVAAENIEKFHIDYLDTIRPELIMRVREELGSLSGSISLHAWKVFHMAAQRLASNEKSDGHQKIVAPKDSFMKVGDAIQAADAGRRDRNNSSMTMRPFYHHISLPTADFAVYIKPLQPTGSFDFISHIRIAGACQIRTEDLLLLPGLKSLGVLEIIEPIDTAQPFPRISDRLIRTWSDDKDPFPQLSILKIYARHNLTEQSLQYVTKFPVVALFEVRGRFQEWQQSERYAAQVGWVRCDWETARSSPHPRRHFDSSLEPSFSQMTEHIGRPRPQDLNVGCWACWAHGTIQTKPLNTSKDTKEAVAAWASNTRRPEVPFASLSLGMDQQTLEKTSHVLGDMERIFFWRRSYLDAAVALKAGSDRSQGATASCPRIARKAAPGQPSRGSQSRKRRQMGSISDLLNDFQS